MKATPHLVFYHIEIKSCNNNKVNNNKLIIQ